MGQLSKQSLPGSPVSNQEISLTGVQWSGEDPRNREAIYPQWFFSSRLGQPRNFDPRTIRELSASPWVQMVETTFKKQVMTTPWDIVAEDEEDETDRIEDIKKIKDFFQNVNDNQQSINDLNSECVTDIAEIDAGVINYVYTAESYTIGEVPVYDQYGNVESTETGLVLKPLGQRELRAMKSVDGATMLKQVDIRKNLLNYWQYSFKHPRQNPTRFEKEEIAYLMMNPKPYDVYGFSPVQSIQQVLELLIQGTRYNKDLYTNNAIPDILVSLPKLTKDKLRKLKRSWNNSYKGKPHQIGFVNWMIDKFHKLADNNRDLEWLNGQKWYFRICFGVFQVSPEEAGFTEDSNRATGDSQERVTVRNALKPYFALYERLHTTKTISEILGREDHGLKFKYFPKDQVAEKIEFEQDIQLLDRGALTINDFRKKKGQDPYEWGDDPLRRPFDPSQGYMNFAGDNPMTGVQQQRAQQDSENQNNEDKNKIFRKKFEGFLNGRKQSANS
jgi:hypothetical protein